MNSPANPLAANIGGYGKKISIIHVILLSSLFAVVSILYHHGGVLHPEMNTRLPFYLADKPLLNKIFDSRILDSGFYRARELSYLLDFSDAKFIELCIRNGFPHFLSLTHYLFSIAIGCLIWLFCVKDLKLHPLIGMGWLALFWTSPSIFLGGDMFRAGKIGVAFLAAIFFRMVFKITTDSQKDDALRPSITFWLLYFITIFAATLLDEQGLFTNITILMFLGIWGLVIRDKNIYIMLAISALSLILHIVYRFNVAPQLTYMLNGYWPSFSYQEMSITDFAKNSTTYLQAGLFLYGETIQFLIGAPSQAIGIGILLLFASFPVFYMYTHKELSANYRKFFSLSLIELLITNVVLLVIMNAVMVFKHPPLISPDGGRVYYWLPTNVILAMTFIILTSAFINSRPPKGLLALAMCLAIIGNIAALPNHKAVMEHGSMQLYFESSPALLDALKNTTTMDSTRDPVIRANPVFEFFSGEYDLGNGIK